MTMRVAAVIVVVLVGCHHKAEPPAQDDALAHLADEACACRGATCRDAVRARWQAATGVEPARKDPPKMTQDEIAVASRLHDARVKYLGCIEPDHGPVRTIARMTEYADRACACRDPACAAAVKHDEDRYLQDAWPQQDGFTDADKQQLTAQLRRFTVCVRDMMPGSDVGSPR